MVLDVPASEARWRAEDDARALAQAEEVKADKARLSKAQEAAKKMADEDAARVRAMRKVAGKRTRQPPDGGSGGGKPKPVSQFNVFEKI